MHTIDQLPPTQQCALRDALKNGPLLRRVGGYIAAQGAGQEEHPIRTIRALVRAGLLQEENSRARLTEQGEAVAEERA